MERSRKVREIQRDGKTGERERGRKNVHGMNRKWDDGEETREVRR